MKIHPEALTAIREGRLLSKKELSGESELSLQYICDLEAGRKPGSERAIRRLADALKVNYLALIANPNEQRIS